MVYSLAQSNTASDLPAFKPQPTRWWFWTLVLLFSMTCTTIVLLVYWQQTRTQLTRERLDAARLRWREHRPAQYRLNIQVSGATSGQYILTVHGQEVTSFSMNGLTELPSKGRAWTVDSFLEEILPRELEGMLQPRPTCFAQVEFDETNGLPRHYLHSANGRSTKIQMQLTALPVTNPTSSKTQTKPSISP